MKTTAKLMACAVALAALSGLYNANADDPATQPASSEGAPMKYNKASGLIGMDVKNPEGEHLGHITDVVLDLKSDRVSYVVMTTAPKATLGIDEKMLAVPLSAFTTSPDQKHLVLNADKEKLKAVPGMRKDNWPDVANPNWGTQQQFWQNPTAQPGQQGNPPKSTQ